MRDLTMNEIEVVSAANGAGYVIAAGVGLLVVAAILSAPSNPYKTVAVNTPYEVITPVYDSYGRYIGDNVDSYVRTDYVTVPAY